MLFRVAGFDIKKVTPPGQVHRCGRNTYRGGSRANWDFPTSVQVFGGCDDTQSAAVGSGSTGEGDAHIYLGTSAWAGITTGKNLKHKNGAVVLQSADAQKNLLVGITESAGANLDWMIEKFYKLEKNDPAIRNIYSFIDGETEGSSARIGPPDIHPLAAGGTLPGEHHHHPGNGL